MQPVELLAELVRRPSVNPMGRADLPADLTLEHRVTNFLEAYLQSLGIPCQRTSAAPGRDNLVAWHIVPGATQTILLEAHQDTVPVEGMTIAPFGGEVRDGKLWGRGACDIKGGMVAMLSAFTQVVQAGTARVNVLLACSVDEEFGLLGVRQLVQSGWHFAGHDLTPSFAIVAEPTGLDIVTAHKGVTGWKLHTAGQACHASRPEQGTNAIYRLAPLLLATERYAAELTASAEHPLLGRPSLSVGVISGGTSVNTVPDWAQIAIDRRLLPGETPSAAVAHFRAALQRMCPDVPFVCDEPWGFCPPLDPAQSLAAQRQLGAAINAVRGAHCTYGVPFGTDASTLALAGIPAVVFGPGDIAQAHTRDEWLDLAQLDAAIAILTRVLTG